MALTYQEVLNLISTLLPDNTTQQISEKDLRDVATAILDRTNQSNISDLNIEWDVATTYALDEIVTYLDRIWKSKVVGNIGHQPPTDPGVTEDTYWIEQSRSEAGSYPEWAPGVYGSGLVIVYYNNSLYKLTVGTRPFNSTNFNTEFAAGNWEVINSAKTSLQNVSHHTELIFDDYRGKYMEAPSGNLSYSVASSGNLHGARYVIRIPAETGRTLLLPSGSLEENSSTGYSDQWDCDLEMWYDDNISRLKYTIKQYTQVPEPISQGEYSTAYSSAY